MSKREKLFGAGRPRPLDRNLKAQLTVPGAPLTRRTEAGKHYGPLTAKGLAVFEALLWGFHNAKSGLCFPSIQRLAETVGCSPTTVQKALRARWRRRSSFTWVNRLIRRREHGPTGWRTRVLRTSNGYRFADLGVSASNAKFRQGTDNQGFSSDKGEAQSDLLLPLGAALSRLGATLGLEARKREAYP